MYVSQKKKKPVAIKNKKSLINYIKAQPEFDEIKELKTNDNLETATFKLKGINIVIEKHTVDRIKLLRIINSFNPKGFSFNFTKSKLIEIANEFNRRSIGVKSAVSEENGLIYVVFTIEEISLDENKLNLSVESLKLNSAILSGAPSLFEKLVKESS
ncbi:hypothetical protein ACR3LQ_00465 [Kosakonia cowanii]|uniref:hypothetical protein n=1 Tax=Kosakonia cowanii TaxID=208223 RepID=UPI003EE7AC78